MTELRVSERAREGDGRCAYCHDALDAEAAATCGDCGVGMHADCADALGRCPTVGCPGAWIAPTPAGARGTTLVGPPPPGAGPPAAEASAPRGRRGRRAQRRRQRAAEAVAEAARPAAHIELVGLAAAALVTLIPLALGLMAGALVVKVWSGQREHYPFAAWFTLLTMGPVSLGFISVTAWIVSSWLREGSGRGSGRTPAR